MSDPTPVNGESDTIRSNHQSNFKRYVRNALLIFVVGSLLYMAVKEIRDRRATAHDDNANAATMPVTDSTKLIVYFFAEGKQCITCENLREYTHEALETYFPGELAEGVVLWRPINVDEKRNEHYVHDYNIYTKSVVLARIDRGKQVRWKNLTDIWDLIGDKKEFIKYIRAQTRAYLDAPL